jgi:signal transduction histidine kinase
VVDLATALECIRMGADDYLDKPAQFSEILFAVRKALQKRRLVVENRRYQEELEKTNFRIQVLHQLSNQMNTVYLSTVALDEILQGILVGITANEGLQFNRAFLAMFNGDRSALVGRLAIGPSCREDAGQIWSDMQDKKLSLLEIVQNIGASCDQQNIAVNAIIKYLKVPASHSEHILIKAAADRRSILVREGKNHDCLVPGELIELLGNDSFVVVPLFSPGRSFGVIIADNFITQRPITEGNLQELELFASQASLAIEQSHLYMDMERKIAQLEALTEELDQNKDLLVKAERYSALGQMAAQMMHAIRNPVTSIGGVARLLARKVRDTEWHKYCSVIIKESERIETTLEDLFNFVSKTEVVKKRVALQPLLHKSLLLLQTTMTRQGITCTLDFPENNLEFELDPALIRQMFVHLFKNAVEAMPTGGELQVTLRRDGDWARVLIRDTGAGIPAGNLERVSDLFFTTKSYGTGLGLSMVERVVTAHGGSFVLRSREGGGTEVQVNLPFS